MRVGCMSVCLSLGCHRPDICEGGAKGGGKPFVCVFYVYIFVPSCILTYISGGVGVNPSSFPNVNMFEETPGYHSLILR